MKRDSLDRATTYYLANKEGQTVLPEPKGKRAKYLDLAGNVIRIDDPNEKGNDKQKTDKR